ncbi:MAG: hypothetical protein H0Z28_11865 [Archaeoglobus sp.]|nr:hypothetical protein [Archaeoglobus sp.]
MEENDRGCADYINFFDFETVLGTPLVKIRFSYKVLSLHRAHIIRE